MFLLLLACAHLPRHLGYDPLARPVPVPLLGGEAVTVGKAAHLVFRNAADHAIWVNEVRVVPEGAARLVGSVGPTELAPDERIALDVDAEGPGALVLRTSEGVRLVPITTAEPAPVEATGQRPRAEIHAVVSSALGLDACYRAGRRSLPALEGRLTTRFAIEPDGRVSQLALLDTTFPAGDVESCVYRAILDLQFPAGATGTVLVTYPFTFTRAPPADAGSAPLG